MRALASFALGTAVVVAAVVAVACSPSGASQPRDWRTSVDTIGDTIQVRTTGTSNPRRHAPVPEMRIGELEGADEYTFGAVSEMGVGAAGDLYVFDRQAMQLRRYGADGRFVRNIGRKGGGPGEYDRVNGLAVATDGRVFLWDAGNARVTIFTAEGEPEATWRMQGGFFTSNALALDSAGRVHTRVGTFGPDVTAWRTIVVRYGAGGAPVDTLETPRFELPFNQIVARRERSTSSNNVPYTASTLWALDREGRFVYGRSDQYALYRERPDGMVLRIEREAAPVAVSGAERSEREARATWQMRTTDPAWRWNGPPIPDVKPYFTNLRVVEDGRIWVQISQPGERNPDADTTETAPNRPPPLLYREAQVWDVFAPDGYYLGQVELPIAFTLFAARGDHVWGVQRDEMDVQYVVRLRIEPSLAGVGERG